MSDKDKIKQEIERRIELLNKVCNNKECETTIAYKDILKFIDSLQEETKPQFPNYESVVDKVFGAGNLESWEYEEAKKLVLLAKEELLKDLEINKESASEDWEEAMERSVSEEPILEFFATGQPTIGAYGEDSLRNQFEAGIEWHENQMKGLLQTEYEKGRFDIINTKIEEDENKGGEE